MKLFCEKKTMQLIRRLSYLLGTYRRTIRTLSTCWPDSHPSAMKRAHPKRSRSPRRAQQTTTASRWTIQRRTRTRMKRKQTIPARMRKIRTTNSRTWRARRDSRRRKLEGAGVRRISARTRRTEFRSLTADTVWLTTARKDSASTSPCWPPAEEESPGIFTRNWINRLISTQLERYVQPSIALCPFYQKFFESNSIRQCVWPQIRIPRGSFRGISGRTIRPIVLDPKAKL